MSLSDKLLVVMPITNADQLEQVRLAAIADPIGHVPLYATHYCMVGNDIIGSLSCCAMPVSGIWSHSQKSNVRLTLEMVNTAHNISRHWWAISGWLQTATPTAHCSLTWTK